MFFFRLFIDLLDLPEPSYGWSWITKNLQLDISVLLLISKELVLAVLKELGGAGQASWLQ